LRRAARSDNNSNTGMRANLKHSALRFIKRRATGSQTMSCNELILASASPRRNMLLQAAGLEFDVVESGIEEVRRDRENAPDFALRMACEKALEVSARYPHAIVLAADTIVECEGQILGKPADSAVARAMLSVLSGNTHTVVTAFAIAHAGAVAESAPVISRVTFRRLSPAEIAAYVAGGDPLDKAGAYGIQSIGAGFIERVDGARDNVMGLPVREVLAALRRHGIVPARTAEN
jgi:septum formation protein